MKTILSALFLCMTIYSIAQKDVTINTSRKNIVPQAVLDVESTQTLYAGQEYTFNVTTSGNYDIRITAQNAKIEFVELSKKMTGGLIYKVTPIAPGKLSMTVWNVIDAKTKCSLIGRNFDVIDYPVPPIQLSNQTGGQFIEQMQDSTNITCAYPREQGIFESYEIKSWKATIGDKTFTGEGSMLSEEIIQYINQVDNEFMHMVVELNKNKTGHQSSEAIYLIK